VLLERLAGGTWKQVARKRQDSWGSAAFAVQPGTYRARTVISMGREVQTGRIVSQAWTPEFEDTFSGDTLDASVWNDQRREHESVYAGRTCSRTDPAARRVEGGVLHLGIALDPERLDQRCQYTTDEGAGEQSYLLTSQVATEYTRLFTHGIAAARMKPQQAKGMHSSFWMLPEGTRFTDGDPSAGTEIDVMEFFGATPNGRETIGSFVSYYEPGWQNVKHGDLFSEARQALGQGARWWDEFHVFSVEWTDQYYIFRVDGREYHRETNAISNAQQYLVLSMLASDYELDDLTPDEFDDTAQVDWVQVYDTTSATSPRVARRKAS
jgi:beta-glucanase (GH16 family)